MKLKYIKMYEDLQTKEDLIEVIEGWIQSIEMQEYQLNITIFARERMQKFVEDLKNNY